MSATNLEGTNKLFYFKLPYIGKTSVALKSKIKRLCQKYKIDMDVRLVFQSFKLRNMFGTKDRLPLKSFVVYKFNCARCEACYVGYTTRHLTTRIHEHLNDKQSHIYKHLSSNPTCRSSCDEHCFEIVDRANTDYELKIKEAFHIQSNRTTINKQTHSYKLSLIL